QFVARLLLEPAFLATAGLLLHALAILVEAFFERLVDCGRRQQPCLAAQAYEVSAFDTPAQQRILVPRRRLPTRAALGVGPTGPECGARKLFGKLLLGLGPRAVQAVEADAAKHFGIPSRVVNGGRGVSGFDAVLSLLQN